MSKAADRSKYNKTSEMELIRLNIIVVYFNYYIYTQMHHFFSLQTLGGAVAPLNWPRVVHEWQFIVDIEQL